MATKRYSKPTRCTDILQTTHRPLMQHMVAIKTLMTAWEEVVGVSLAAVAHPTKLEGKVLYIAVKDTIWIQELDFLKTDLINKLQQLLPMVTIEKLRYERVDWLTSKQPITTDKPLPAKTSGKPQISQAAVAKIKNPVLKAQFEQLLAMTHAS